MDNKPEPHPALLELVKALARQQARLYAAAGIHPADFDEYARNPSPESAEAVREHMNLALDIAFKVKRK